MKPENQIKVSFLSKSINESVARGILTAFVAPLDPTIEELAKEYDGQIYIYKLDTQAEPEVASVFGIKSIPSLLFIPLKGQPQMAQGALPKDVLKQIIDTVLLGKPAQQPTENRADNKLKE